MCQHDFLKKDYLEKLFEEIMPLILRPLCKFTSVLGTNYGHLSRGPEICRMRHLCLKTNSDILGRTKKITMASFGCITVVKKEYIIKRSYFELF